MAETRRTRMNVIASPIGAKQSQSHGIASPVCGLLAMTSMLFFFTPLLYACPMCTDLVEHGADASKSWRFGLGIGWSILVMLGILFSMIGAFIFAIWKGQKKSSHSSPGEVSGGIHN